MSYLPVYFSKHQKVLKLWTAVLFIKILISKALPLFSDESYYWVWGQNLRLSYFDHPPMIAWLFKLGASILSEALTPRWPIILMGHLTMLIWYFIVFDSTKSEKVFNIWFGLVLFSPLLGLGSLIGTPDVPLVFFWSLSLLFFQKLLKTPEKSAYYILLGVSLGLGFCSKYHIVLFVPFLFLFLILNHTFLKKIHWRYVPLTFIFGILFSMPVILWNFENDFQSFRFQIDHGLTHEPFNASWPFLYILGQIALISPFLLTAIYKSIRNHPYSLNAIFGLGPILFFMLTSFKGHVEANWPIIAIPSLLYLTAEQLDFFPKLKKFHFLSLGILYGVVCFSYLSPQFPLLNEKLQEPFKYTELTEAINQYKPLYASKYQMASALWYLTKKPFYKLPEMSRYDFFDTLLQKPDIQVPFFVIVEELDELPAWVEKNKYKVTQTPFTSKHFKILKISRIVS